MLGRADKGAKQATPESPYALHSIAAFRPGLSGFATFASQAPIFSPFLRIETPPVLPSVQDLVVSFACQERLAFRALLGPSLHSSAKHRIYTRKGR